MATILQQNAIVCLMTLIIFTAKPVQSTSSCISLYISIEDFGDSTSDPGNWNGVYTLDNSTSFNASVWTIPTEDSNRWLKYIETHWVLSGQNSELMIYETTSLEPPINATTTWQHEFESETAEIALRCSSTMSPTASPTVAPSTAPVWYSFVLCTWFCARINVML